ncbi:hypothetical protein WDW86_12810 [Bdellovibrionota bacterium FG-2]
MSNQRRWASALIVVSSASCVFGSSWAVDQAVVRGKAFNPDISANFLGLGAWGSDVSEDPNQVPHRGLSLQEAELQFVSDVDPYFRASALFSIAQDLGSAGFGISPEEVYLETISLPFVTFRAGKMKLAMGKHNQLHTHAFAFVDAPLVSQALFGSEGLNEAGVSASILVPLSWYSEFVVQGFSPTNDTFFGVQPAGSLGSLGHWKNLWDLSDDLTLELGASGVQGNNQFNSTSYALGGDLTFKWRPAIGGKYRALIWSTEYLQSRGSVLAGRLGGVASWVQYQFAQRWWIEGRGEWLGIPHSEEFFPQHKASALLGFFPSEFSEMRLQADQIVTQGKVNSDYAVLAQYVISIGAHPAHAY